MAEPYVLVVGMSCLDMKGRASDQLLPGTSVPGTVRVSHGGVGRNIAENLARLGVRTALISAVGEDRSGQRILAQATEVGIETEGMVVVPGTSTGAYLALLHPDGTRAYAIDDTHIGASITPRHITNHRRLMRDATMAVVDANVSPAALTTLFRLAGQYGVPVCADSTSVALAPRLQPHLSQLLLITPNVREAEILCQQRIKTGDRDAALAACRCMVAQGVQTAVITMAEEGLCYATLHESGYVPALLTEVIDPTGGGDALTAAIVFALLNQIPVSEAMRLGCSAASLTIACDQTVVPGLTLELLYDHLSV
jgi:pseudouridine kinase